MAYTLATLDACVLIPSSVRDMLLRCDRAGMYRCRWSEEILDEVARHLREEGTQPGFTERLLHAMRSAIKTAMVEDGYRMLTPLMTNHPKDRHVLAVAVSSQSEFIVTENLRDFPPASLAPYGLQAVSADAFLCMLAERDPQTMIAVAEARAAKMKAPPRTFDQMLDQLGTHLPQTVELMRRAQGST